MDLLSRLVMILIVSLGLAAPAGAAVPVAAPEGTCDVVAADDDEKPEGEEEPDCE